MLENNNAAKLEESQPHKKHKSLGRGLGALLGDDDFNLEESLNAPLPGMPENSNFVSLDLISPCPYQPRTKFDEEALKSLAQSVKEKGVLQPLLVRKTASGYELIAGERRLRASKLAGLKEVPVIVKEMSDQEVLEVALVENLLRENLSAIEEAEGLQRLMTEFSHTQEALAQIVGKSRSHIANTLRLLSLPDSVKDMIKDGKLSAGQARNLVGLDNAEELALMIIKKDLNVRQVEELINKLKSGNKTDKKESPAKDSDIAEIERDLNRSLGLRIKINPGKQGGGKVILQYASVAELDMIIDILEQKRKTGASFLNNDTVSEEPDSKFTMKIVD